MLVLEAIEHTRLHEAAPRLIRVVYGGELEEDEDVVRVVDATEDPLQLRLLARLSGDLDRTSASRSRSRPPGSG
jgi:hypothetical protein